MYLLLYHPRAAKFLKKIPPSDSARIVKKLSILSRNPTDAPSLDVKKLATTKRSYRLRIGTLRVIYEIDAPKRVLYIHEIGFRGSIY